MHWCSREFFVGSLLVLALLLLGCQPVQPVEVAPESTDATNGANLDGPAQITETAGITPGMALTTTSAVTQTGTMTSSQMPTSEATGQVTASESSAAHHTTGATADPAVIAAGLATYRAQYCGICHLSDAAETRGTFGPPHTGMAATAAARLADGTYSGATTTPAEYILESIVAPQVFIVPGYATTSHRMPTYAHLDVASLDALVAFLLAQ